MNELTSGLIKVSRPFQKNHRTCCGKNERRRYLVFLVTCSSENVFMNNESLYCFAGKNWALNNIQTFAIVEFHDLEQILVAKRIEEMQPSERNYAGSDCRLLIAAFTVS